MITPVVSPGLRHAIENDVSSALKVLEDVPVESVIPRVLDTARYDLFYDELQAHVGDLEGKHLLEVGCGYGMMVVHGRLNRGLDVRGLEPPKEKYEGRCEMAQRLLSDNALPGR
jgi:hypothetical protein